MPHLIRVPAMLVLCELAIATAWALRGIAHFAVPDAPLRSLLARAVPPCDDIWAVCWILALPLIAYGALRGVAEVLASGWTILGIGLAMALVVSIWNEPLDPRTYGTAAYLAVAVSRVWVLRPEHRARHAAAGR